MQREFCWEPLSTDCTHKGSRVSVDTKKPCHTPLVTAELHLPTQSGSSICFPLPAPTLPFSPSLEQGGWLLRGQAT